MPTRRPGATPAATSTPGRARASRPSPGATRPRRATRRDRFGWESVETDWRRLLERDDIDIIDICTPGDTHAEIAVAALEAGKHVLCEKPLANSVEEAELMVRGRRGGRRPRRPLDGRLHLPPGARPSPTPDGSSRRAGSAAILHVRGAYLQDWLVDPESPLTWRLQKERAGSGALGDVGAHIVDLAQFVTGERLTGVSALTETFVRERPVSDPRRRARAASAARPAPTARRRRAGDRRRRGRASSRG